MPLTSKQMEYLALAWQCFESEPKIDYAKFARVAGLASPASARESMRLAKTKLRDEYGSSLGGAASRAGSSAPATPQKKRAAAGTPGKRGTTTPGSGRAGTKRKAGAGLEGDEHRDDEEVVVGHEESPNAKKARKIEEVEGVEEEVEGVKEELGELVEGSFLQ